MTDERRVLVARFVSDVCAYVIHPADRPHEIIAQQHWVRATRLVEPKEVRVNLGAAYLIETIGIHEWFHDPWGLL